jgi:hypothetical protein
VNGVKQPTVFFPFEVLVRALGHDNNDDLFFKYNIRIYNFMGFTNW